VAREERLADRQDLAAAAPERTRRLEELAPELTPDEIPDVVAGDRPGGGDSDHGGDVEPARARRESPRR
jgi:hypothetical protein